MSPRRDLPDRPDIEQIKKQAKELVRAHRAGQPECVPRLREHVYTRPSWSDDDVLAAKFSLLDAQLVMAREYGFDNWHGLALHVAQARDESVMPTSSRPVALARTRTTPAELSLGSVYEDARIEASFAHVLNVAAADVNARVTTPDFVRTLSVDTYPRQTRQRGECNSDVVVKLEISTHGVGQRAGAIRVDTSAGHVDVPVSLDVLSRPASQRRILLAETPFRAHAFDQAADLAVYHRIVKAGEIDADHVLELPDDLEAYSAVVLCGRPLALVTSQQEEGLSRFVASGGRLVIAASGYQDRAVRAANGILDSHEMWIGATFPQEPYGQRQQAPELFTLPRIGSPNRLKWPDPLTEGVESLVFQRPSPIRISAGGAGDLLALAPAPLYHGDGFAAVCRGAGEVVVLSHSTWWHWMSLGGDNARFLLNLLAGPALQTAAEGDATIGAAGAWSPAAAGQEPPEPLSEVALQTMVREARTRSARDILDELEALHEPKPDTPYRENPTRHMRQWDDVEAWAYFRARLIRELYVSHPGDEALTDLMPERWELLSRAHRTHSAREDYERAFDEIDEMLGRDIPPLAAQKARFARLDLLMRGLHIRGSHAERWRRARNANIRRAIDECLAHHADDRRMPGLLARQANGCADDELQAKRFWQRLLTTYPDSHKAKFARGKVRQVDELHQPFEMSFTDALTGDVVATTQHLGKLVVDFWAPSCGFCKGEHATMRELLDGYGSDRIAYFGVCLDDDIDAMRDHCDEHGVTWPQWRPGGGWSGPTACAWGIDGLPTQFLLAADGTLYSTDARGNLDWMVPALLAEPLPPA